MNSQNKIYCTPEEIRKTFKSFVFLKIMNSIILAKTDNIE